jgi:hypothetical protein
MVRKSVLVLIVSVLFLVGVSVWAQTRRDPTAITTAPEVISGENIGVRVIGASDKNGPVQGTLVVQINGRWVDVVSPVIIGTTK